MHLFPLWFDSSCYYTVSKDGFDKFEQATTSPADLSHAYVVHVHFFHALHNSLDL